MTDWNAGETDYLNTLARTPAARSPATIGEIWNAEWTRSGLDTISGVGRPFTESYDELRSAIEKHGGDDIATLAYRNNVNIGAAATPDQRIAALNALADTLPDEQKKAIDPFRDVRKRAADKAQTIERDAADVAANTYGLSGQATAFLAGIARQAVDPINLAANVATAPIGGEFAGPILRVVARQAGAGALAQAVVEPYVQSTRGELGLESGFKQGALDVAQAAIGAGGLAGLFRAGKAGFDLMRAPRAVAPDVRAPQVQFEPTFVGYIDSEHAAALDRGEVFPRRPAVALGEVPDTVPGFGGGFEISEGAQARPTRTRAAPEPAPPPSDFSPGYLTPEDIAGLDRGHPVAPIQPVEPLDTVAPWRGFDGLSSADLEAAGHLAERDQVIDAAAPPQWDRGVHHAMVDEAAAALEAGRPVERANAAAAMREAGMAPPRLDAVADNVISTNVTPGKRFGVQALAPEKYSLFQFLASVGGLHPQDKAGRDSAGRIVRVAPGQELPGGGMTGDLAYVLDGNPFVPGFGQLLRDTGHSLDRARELAQEAGYLPEGSTPADLLAAIDEEARGNKLYRPGQERVPQRDAAAERAQLAEHRAGLATDFDARMAQLEITKITRDQRRRALQIMEKEGQPDPLLAFEQALQEHTDRKEALRAARLKDQELGPIPGWDVVDEPGAAPPHGGAAAGEPGARPGEPGAGGEPRTGGEGARAAGQEGQLGDPALAADAGRLLDQHGGDLEITIKLPDGTIRKGSARDLLAQADEEARAAAELIDCAGGAAPEGGAS